jgi:beta-glucanase (GH16 family)
MHTPSSFGGTVNVGGQTIATASTAFHIYSLDWYVDKMVFSVDGKVHYTYQPATLNANTWPFDKEQYLLLNVAIQSSIFSGFTQGAMEIDYVRVYKEKTLSTNENASIKESIRFSPNPVKDILTVNIPENFSGSKIAIFSLLGQKIATFNSKDTTLTIDTSSYKSGIYIMQILNNNENVCFKIIKE